VKHHCYCRELTEPECDRDYSSLGRDQERGRSREEDQVENISSEQLQEELDRIIANYKEKKNKLNSKQASDEKFIISV